MVKDASLSKGRKLFYDDHTSSFIAESRIEALERTCRQRERQAETMNRGEKLVLDSKNHKIQGSHNLFTMKYGRDRDVMRDGLKDKVAYRSVLGVIGQLNDRDPHHNQLYGRYGQDTNRLDLAPLVDAEMVMMSPAAKRKQKADDILTNRKKIEIFDRRLPTSALFRIRMQSRKSADRPIRTGEPRRGRLILPPIQVSKSPVQVVTPNVTVNTTEIRNHAAQQQQQTVDREDTNTIQTVFITSFNKEYTR